MFKTHFNCMLSHQAADNLTELSSSLGLTQSEVVRRGIRVLKHLNEFKNKRGEVTIIQNQKKINILL